MLARVTNSPQIGVDPSQGRQQNYIEDCQVCCRPNQLQVSYDEWNEQYIIRAEQAQ